MNAPQASTALTEAEEANVRAVRRFFVEVINAGRIITCQEICTPDAQLHAPLPDPGRGPEGLANIAKGLRRGFPDINVEVDDVIARDDKVVVRWHTSRQTHRSIYRGLPPTDVEVRTTAMHIFRMQDGKIAEAWLELDALGGARQMGIVPPEEISSGGRLLFVLGSILRFARLQARYELRKRKRERESSGSAEQPARMTPL